jgi:SAM-dependent methyltransferase
MTESVDSALDWPAWLDRWDAMMEAYWPDREARFAAMWEALETLVGDAFQAVDLGAGPGSTSVRLLTRFPRARVLALDLDPVLMAVGQGALGTMDGRLRWAEADIVHGDWPASFGEGAFDAVVTTSVLHAVPAEHVPDVYRRAYQALRTGGVLLNGDAMEFAPELTAFERIAKTQKERRETRAFRAEGREDWVRFSDALFAEPGMAERVAERERRFALRPREYRPAGAELHLAALRDAGFVQAGVIWQDLDNRVLLAVR